MQSVEDFVVEPLPGFPPEIGAGLWTLLETRRRTLKYVDGIGADALDRRPSGHRHSVATLLYHIAVVEVDWLYVHILGGGHNEERRIPESSPEVAARLPYPKFLDDGSYTPVSGEPLDVHLERLAFIRERFLNALQGMTVDEFRTLRFTGEDRDTPEWVVQYWLPQHEAEHRGQIWGARVAAEAELSG